MSDPPSMDESDFSSEGLNHIERDLQIKYSVIFEKIQKLDEHLSFSAPVVKNCCAEAILHNILLPLKNFPQIFG